MDNNVLPWLGKLLSALEVYLLLQVLSPQNPRSPTSSNAYALGYLVTKFFSIPQEILWLRQDHAAEVAGIVTPSEDSGFEETDWDCKSENSSGPSDGKRKHVDESERILFSNYQNVPNNLLKRSQ